MQKRSVDEKDIAEFLKVLSCEWRVKIIEIISDREVCQCELVKVFPIDFTTLSRHLKALKNADVLQERKVGRSKYYSLKNKRILEIIKLSRQIIEESKE
ncbi:MAG: winged helix-turn-helix transcriptional regulator [Thermotogaceae bacterium]|nr:winged helix-turn-helix transcriptional regulator [Thermotogaceae bacterium]